MSYIVYGIMFLIGAISSNFIWGPCGEGLSGFSLGMASGMVTIGILSLFDK